jgi:hypothetical protein
MYKLGFCIYGPTCRYRHVFTRGEPRAGRVPRTRDQEAVGSAPGGGAPAAGARWSRRCCWRPDNALQALPQSQRPSRRASRRSTATSTWWQVRGRAGQGRAGRARARAAWGRRCRPRLAACRPRAWRRSRRGVARAAADCPGCPAAQASRRRRAGGSAATGTGTGTGATGTRPARQGGRCCRSRGRSTCSARARAGRAGTTTTSRARRTTTTSTSSTSSSTTRGRPARRTGATAEGASSSGTSQAAVREAVSPGRVAW